MKLLIIINIPSPYRLVFFNELGKKIDLTVLFEVERNYALNEKWYTDKILNFKGIFLKAGAIEEKKVNFKIFRYLNKNDYDFILVTIEKMVEKHIKETLIKYSTHITQSDFSSYCTKIPQAYSRMSRDFCTI